MKEHIALNHDSKKYFKCKLCCKNFGQCNNLLKHSSFHDKNKVFHLDEFRVLDSNALVLGRATRMSPTLDLNKLSFCNQLLHIFFAAQFIPIDPKLLA